VSFDQLMQHAAEIQLSAMEEAIKDLGKHNSSAYINQSVSEIQSEFADIPEIFRPFAEMPDPRLYDPMIEQMRLAVGKLAFGDLGKDPIANESYPANPVLTMMSGAERYLQGWTGRAAMRFTSDFIDPFPAVIANQFIVAAILKSALEAQREVWVSARRDIDAIAHGTIAALDRMDDCDKNEWTVTFTVVSSIAAVAAIPLSGGTSLMVTGVGAGAQVLAAIPMDDPPEIAFSGETAHAVVAEMREAVGHLTMKINEQEVRIADALRGMCAVVEAEPSLFRAGRPALVDGLTSDLTSPTYMGYCD
jgi:hypothetical protein